ncbi:MAG TPA: Shedu anti-phage system protein SduA domain-containing protein [Thermoanaerobaculia bacterium]|jgi:cold shock CspA family protein|nr:Shedu anti-phage system protein SduA domain-containing protein [Thermoanaerobaculia bacterium]
MYGTIKTLTDREFGFISVNDSPDLFFHSKELIGVTFDELKVGDVLSFDVQEYPERATTVNTGSDGAQPPQEMREQLADQAMMALKLVDEQVRVQVVTRDGAYQFVDPNLNVHSLLYIDSETRALKHAVEELESLLNQTNVAEAVFQDFFERYPEFIMAEEHRTAHSHMVLEDDTTTTRLIPDFVLEPLKPNALSDILEVKLPYVPLYVKKPNRIRFSAAVIEACAQLREYSAFFDSSESREKIARRYGLQLYRPNLFLVIGRTTKISPILERRIQSDVGLPLQLRTFDDVVARI